jgi:uncharacterized protein YkwD
VGRLLRLLSCTLVAFAALALGTGSAATAAAGCADATLRPTNANLERIRAATLCLLNAERADHGLPTLRANERLTRAAEAYSAKMVRRRFFAHVCPEGSTLKSRIRSVKYLNKSVRDYSLGENLAWGSGSLSTPKSIVRGWMRSSGHRHAILDEGFQDVGVGVAPGAPRKVRGRAATYTAEFGYRITST